MATPHEATDRRLRHAAWAALAVLLAGVAWWALPRTVQPGDAGEFATVMLRGGVPHPSGYPWMRVLGLFAAPLHGWWGLAPATAAAVPCALAGVGAWLVLQPVLVRIAGVFVATFAAALGATASIVVLHACDSEVWGPHLLFVAIVVRLALRTEPVAALRLGLVLGLAVSHHLTAVLLVPVVVAATWPARKAGEAAAAWAGRIARTGAEGLGGSAIGLSFFATLAIGSGQAWRWGDVHSVSGLLHHVARADYGVLQLSLHAQSVAVTDQWTRVFGSLGGALTGGLSDLPGLGLAVLVLIFVAAVRRPPSAVPRLAWWGVLGSALLSTLAFPALHNIEPSSPFGAWILERFDLMSVLLWTVVLACALQPLSQAVAGRRVLLGVAAVALLAHQLVTTARRGVASDDDTVQRYAVDLLRTPQPGQRALVFGTDDHRSFPVLFAQQVLGEGPEVLYVDASLLAHPWYRAWLRRRWPDLPDVDKPLRLMAAVWSDSALSSIPIYLANDFSRPSTQLGRVPEGILWRVVPPGAETRGMAPGPQLILARHRAAFGRYLPQRRPLSPRDAHPFTPDLAGAYNDHTARLVEALVSAGRIEQAQALADELLAPQ